MSHQNDHEQPDEGRDRDDIPYYDFNNQLISVVECETTAGPFAIELRKDWSPLGYDRALELFERGFYDNSHFFRVVPNFLVQFGISYTEDKELQRFASQTIKDDPQFNPRIKFDEGVVAFAGSGENSRTSHLFVSYGENENLGTQPWETPVGVVVRGMDTLLNLNHEYGDMPPWGKGPVQHKIHDLGLKYMEEEFPHLDRFLTCHVVHEEEKNEANEINGEADDMIEVDSIKIAPKTEKTALRAANTLDSAMNGYEMPVLGAIAIMLLILICISKRKMGNHSKSL